MSKTTRRDFIKTGAGAISAGIALPVLNNVTMGQTVVGRLRKELAGEPRILVIIELAGGNDGLNTIIPLKQYDSYASFRTRIAIPKEQVLPLYGSTTMGLSPNLAGLKPLADAGQLAVVQAVHYPNPNLSHESSRLIYHRGYPDPEVRSPSATGWIGRHSAIFGNPDNPVDTIGLGGRLVPMLSASGANTSSVKPDNNGNLVGYGFETDIQLPGDHNNRVTAARQMDPYSVNDPYTDLIEKAQTDLFRSIDPVKAAAVSSSSSVTYPRSAFAGGLKLIARLATSTMPALGTRVFYITIGDFDTHSFQLNRQRTQFLSIANALKIFFDDLAANNLYDKTMVMIWSEFGRRVADNASEGTDHGMANNIYLLGKRVKGGVYGADPSLTDLQAGSLKWKIDYRSVYQTIIESWFGNSNSDAQRVLAGDFGNLGFIA
ncbi:MAG: DUF1501 domain-containing protein [Blastocatellia bacterium]